MVRALALALLVAACAGIAQGEPERDLLERFELTAGGPTTTTGIDIGNPRDVPWALYLDASRAIGLDFAPLAGVSGELRTTPLTGRHPGMRMHVLLVAGTVRGAWLSVEDAVPGIYALTDPPD